MPEPQELDSLYSYFDAHNASEGQLVNHLRRTIYVLLFSLNSRIGTCGFHMAI